MFLGHFGLAYGSKRVAPRLSLATLCAAAVFVDLLSALLQLLGLETTRVVPHANGVIPIELVQVSYTHSLLMGIVWSGIFGGSYWLVQRRVRESVLLGSLVLSHWFLDFLVHVPDLPLYPGSIARYGLGLWRSLPWALAVEGGLFVAGITIYLTYTLAVDSRGQFGAWIVVVLLAIVGLGSFFGPPPPSAAFIAYTALFGTAATLLLMGWTDRHRVLRSNAAAGESS